MMPPGIINGDGILSLEGDFSVPYAVLDKVNPSFLKR